MAITTRKITYDYRISNEYKNLFNIQREEKLIKRALKREENQKKYKAKKELSAKEKEQKLIVDKAKMECLQKHLKDMIKSLVDEILAEAEKTNAVLAFEKYSAQVNKLKKLDDQFCDILKANDPRNRTSFYDYLFLLLTNKNKDFFYVTPFDALTHAYASPLLDSNDDHFHFSRLSREEMLKLQQFYIAKDKEYRLNVENYKSIFTDEYFQRNYLRYFPAFIGLLNTTKDISRALIIDPSKYLEISPENIRVLSYYLTRSPEVFKYLSQEEIYHIAKFSTNKFGTLLIKMPEMLSRLDKDFFMQKEHTFKNVFALVTASELSPYSKLLSKFTGWNDYFDYKSKWINCNRKVTTRRTKEERLAEIKAQLEDTNPID